MTTDYRATLRLFGITQKNVQPEAGRCIHWVYDWVYYVTTYLSMGISEPLFSTAPKPWNLF